MSKQYQEQKKKWFEQGKKQATSDILKMIEEVEQTLTKEEGYEENEIVWIKDILFELKQKIQGVKGE